MKLEKVKIIINMVFRVLLILAGGVSIFNHNWMNLFLILLTFVITFIPSIIERKFSIDYPNEFEIAIILFIFASLFLGELNYFYYKFYWWDLFLHALSGIIIANIGFSLVYVLNRQKEIMIYLTPSFTILFTFSFCQMIAISWEIFEFSMDIIFNLNMQKSGLMDTMGDLIIFFISSGIYCILGYVYFKSQSKFKKRTKILNNFLKNNQHFFDD